MTETHAARQLFRQNVALNCTDCKWHKNSRSLPAHLNCVSMHMLEEIPWRAEVHETVLRQEKAVADRYNSDGALLSSPPARRKSRERPVFNELIDSLEKHTLLLFYTTSPETRAWNWYGKKTTHDVQKSHILLHRLSHCDVCISHLWHPLLGTEYPN